MKINTIFTNNTNTLSDNINNLKETSIDETRRNIAMIQTFFFFEIQSLKKINASDEDKLALRTQYLQFTATYIDNMQDDILKQTLINQNLTIMAEFGDKNSLPNNTVVNLKQEF